MKNLKASLVAVFFFLAASVSFGQTFSYGIKGGLNLSDISSDVFSNTESRTGMNVYAFADLDVLIAAASLEAGYTQKGSDLIFISTNQLNQETGRAGVGFRLNYLDVSLLGKLRLPGAVIAPYILAGPSLGLKLGGSHSTDDTTYAQFSSDYDKIIENFKSSTFGIKFGLGAEVTATPLIKIIIEARYNPDLTYAYDLGLVKAKNKVFEFIAGVKF